MHVCFVYHPQERYLVEPIRERLANRGVECRLAPAGLPIMGEQWRQRVDEDITTAFATVAFVTLASRQDESVSYRLELARKSKTRFIPMENVRPNMDPVTLQHYAPPEQAIQYITEDQAVTRFFSAAPELDVVSFLSYSREDHNIASNIRRLLEADGYRVWQDTSGIRGGVLWDE